MERAGTEKRNWKGYGGEDIDMQDAGIGHGKGTEPEHKRFHDAWDRSCLTLSFTMYLRTRHPIITTRVGKESVEKVVIVTGMPRMIGFASKSDYVISPRSSNHRVDHSAMRRPRFKSGLEEFH
jgi:hypothetical protein